jgi:hypothetical protein
VIKGRCYCELQTLSAAKPTASTSDANTLEPHGIRNTETTMRNSRPRSWQ